MLPTIVDTCPLCPETTPHAHFRGGGTWFTDGRFVILGQRDSGPFYAPVCERVADHSLVALLAMTIEANGMIMN